ncbi:MAG TPA: hypothetical protein PKE63_03380 [Lacibacter sp.]|nr:hypothetical protein [Lacibacter sp.]HMO88406.1 hypothetical protein [Lacibacter sp.]HMP86290.1 hypothetical protein [Lacibacter sp.]
MRKNGHHLYKWAWLGLLPLLGVPAGLTLVFAGIFRYKNHRLALAGLAATLVSFLLSAALFFRTGSFPDELPSDAMTEETSDSASRNPDFTEEEPEADTDAATAILPVNPFADIFEPLLSVRTDSGETRFRLNNAPGRKMMLNEDRSGKAKQDMSPASPGQLKNNARIR